MDINTIVESFFNNTSKVQETLPKSSLVNTPSENVFAKKMSDWQAEALLSLKKDPAVLEAKVSIKDEDVVYPQKTVQPPIQPPNTPTEFQPRSTPEAKLNRLDFENKMCLERAALLSLPSDQFTLILKYVQILRQQRMSVQRQNECGFCKNNRQPEVWYTTHVLKDAKGRVRCPVLRSYVCPLCRATGDRAHTVTHCRKRWMR